MKSLLFVLVLTLAASHSFGCDFEAASTVAKKAVNEFGHTIEGGQFSISASIPTSKGSYKFYFEIINPKLHETMGEITINNECDADHMYSTYGTRYFVN